MEKVLYEVRKLLEEKLFFAQWYEVVTKQLLNVDKIDETRDSTRLW